MGFDAKPYNRPSDEELKKKLTPEQYTCARENGTEKPFENKYWNHHEPGLYLDIVNQEPLFSSLDKFDSGSGWPSFSKPLSEHFLVKKDDNSHGRNRTEIRSARADSHLGHVFDDGPKDKGGLRYCVNSASLTFVHIKDFKKKGLGDYLKLFPKAIQDQYDKGL